MNEMQRDLQELESRLWPDPPGFPAGAARKPSKHPARSGSLRFALGGLVSAAIIAAVTVSVALNHSFSNPQVAATPAPQVATTPTSSQGQEASDITRVTVNVPRSPLTFEVASGSTLALHLQLLSGTPNNGWGAPSIWVGTDSTPAGPLVGAAEVPYPDQPAAPSASEEFVAFTFTAAGTYQIAIMPPSTCPADQPCAPTLQNLAVRVVSAPLNTATITGRLTASCGGSCIGPAPRGTTITFRNETGATVVGDVTDANGDYIAEVPPGTWEVETSPLEVGAAVAPFSVVAGAIRILDVEVVSS